MTVGYVGQPLRCSVFNMADEGAEPTKDFNFAKKNYLLMEQEGKADSAAVFVAICLGCTGTRMAKFLLSLWRDPRGGTPANFG